MGGEPTGGSDRRVFVTGGAGVLGQALLAELDHDDVLCLTHRKPPPVPAQAQVPGDLREPRMGLDPARFRELAARTRCVVHAGAVTSWSREPAEIVATNRAGTEQALELAATARAPIHYVSTAFMPLAHTTRVASGRTADPLDFDRGIEAYLASKAEADAMVATSGLPHTIIRPSYIIGDSRTGRIARFQGLYWIVSLALRNMVPAVPVKASAYTDFVPQDLVARAIAALIECDVRDGEFWITAGAQAMRAVEFLDFALELASELGIDAHRPRLVPPAVVDRLIRPVFISKLPERPRRRFDELLAMTAILAQADVLPSSLAAIEQRCDADLDFDQRTALERSLIYWAEAKGLVAPRSAVP